MSASPHSPAIVHRSNLPSEPCSASVALTTVVTADWSLLTSDLTFLYLDPVLAAHLGEQADRLVGQSLLAYVHPDEQESAKADLGAVLESRTLHGSVTRYVSQPFRSMYMCMRTRLQLLSRRG